MPAQQRGPAIHSFKTWDELEIAYHEWGERSATEIPVVLHHGFVADAPTNWHATGIVGALLARGRWVVGPDARGHGLSEKPYDSTRYGEQAMARDLAALVDHLGAERIDLAGYSMGAIVSLLFAAADPRVRRLVVGGVGAGVVECGGVDRRAVSNESIIQALSAEDAASLQQPDARSFRLLADALGADRRALLAQASSVYRGGVALDRITAPTLVIAGEEDPLAVRPQVLADAIPDGSLKLTSGDHMSALADPGFTTALVDFLCMPGLDEQ
ncbi:MAG TPA: alpha/beta fold hydrolase [Solirubrobacteraceae bacterium]